MATLYITEFQTIGIAVGQLVYGPLSDHYGRRPLMLAGLALYTASALVASLAQSIELLILGRIAQALGGCAGIVITRAIIRDVFDLREASSMLSLMMLVQGLGPVLAPIVGARVVAYATWQWIFVLLAVCVTVLVLLRDRWWPGR